MATDPTTYKSFHDFYSNAHGVRTRFLEMTARVARSFGTVPGVIGYDLLNEPWGDERCELAPLYCEAAAAIRAGHPTALVFVEGQLTTNTGLQTKLPRPPFGGVVYAPHYYKPVPILLGRWYGVQGHINRAFTHMTSTADEWGVPLFLGEFGMPSDVDNAGEFIAGIYDRLDACLASGAQWNYTPTWTEQLRDGWNGENFNILDHCGVPRPNFRPRPYPRLTAGIPLRFCYQEVASIECSPTLEFVWSHDPTRGVTELFVPTFLFPPGASLLVEPPDVSYHYDARRQVLVCHSPRPETAIVRLFRPPGCTSPQ
jgi:endoglycosylceramidase